MTLPTRSNRSAVLVGAKQLEIHDRPTKDVGPNEVLVQVIATGICGSDSHNWHSDKLSKKLVLGHESAGIISELGKDVKHLSVGQRVAIEPGFACFDCEFCKRDQPNICANLKYCGLDPTDGTLCQYFVCGAHMLVPIPDAVSWEEAGAIQPLAIAVQVSKRASFREGQTVAVFGCGPLGLLILAVARACGVKKIVVFDIEQKRIDFALKYGADIGITPPQRQYGSDPLEFAQEFSSSIIKHHDLGFGFDVAVEASGAEPCVHMALTSLKPGGTCIQAGLGKQLPTVPLFLLTARELNIKGIVRYTPGCYAQAIKFLAHGEVDLKPLITAKYPLTKAQDAFVAQDTREFTKIIIMNQE